MAISTTSDPNICGEDGPITAEECALWLDAKYRRHGELEDRAAAMWLRKLSARGRDETSVEYQAQTITSLCDRLERIHVLAIQHYTNDSARLVMIANESEGFAKPPPVNGPGESGA